MGWLPDGQAGRDGTAQGGGPAHGGGRHEVARGARAQAGGGAPDAMLSDLEASFDAALRLEQEAYAESVAEEHVRSQPFRARLLEVRYGLPVIVRLVDGTSVQGRVVAVGADWFALSDATGPGGLGGRIRHEIRIDAVVSLQVEA
jgi:hypothetical protein